MKTKSKAENFADSLKDCPEEILEWCNREIKEYQSLIDILEKRGVKIRPIK